MSTAEKQSHTIDPVFDGDSKILILGSFPSVKSREVGFFYGHPSNRFWPVLGRLFSEQKLVDRTASIEEKKDFLRRHHIALWDVIASCTITGSADSSISDVMANDIAGLIQTTNIKIIYCNGSTSKKLYEKYIANDPFISGKRILAVGLPSTSPANASFSETELVSAWARIKTALNRTAFEEPYYSLNSFLKDNYGRKLYKLSLDGGFTCPNRDGRVGTGGCTFCDGGSGDFAGKRDRRDTVGSEDHADIRGQLAYQKKLIERKMPKSSPKEGPRYIAYFQSYTGTYDKAERLKTLYMEAVEDPEVAVLSVATRPDCLEDDVLLLLRSVNEIKPVWIELGLQTIHESTANAINRGYDLKTYEKAIRKLHRAGISQIITHMIIGLPGETADDIIETAYYIGNSGASGIKLQLLHVLEGTALADDYRVGAFNTLTMEEYLNLLKACVDVLPQDIVVHRLTGDGNKAKLLAPLWSADKKKVINAINQCLK